MDFLQTGPMRPTQSGKNAPSHPNYETASGFWLIGALTDGLAAAAIKPSNTPHTGALTWKFLQVCPVQHGSHQPQPVALVHVNQTQVQDRERDSHPECGAQGLAPRHQWEEESSSSAQRALPTARDKQADTGVP